MLKKISPEDVLVYYPNIIGYIRIACMFLSFFFATSNWKLAMIFYLCAFIGDVVDGYVARAFRQCSQYGGVLDMVTDRVSTCGLLMIVSHFYPSYLFGFVFLVVLDIGSHWFHVASVTAHHKSKEALEHRNALLQWYYSIYPLFAYCCVGTEIFYVLLYILHFYQHPMLEKLCFFGCLPGCIIKNIINIVQFSSACYAIASHDAIDANDKLQDAKKGK